MTGSTIAAVEALHLRAPRITQKADGTQEVLLVRITTEDGGVGFGEAVSNCTVVRAIIEAPMADKFRHGLAVAITGLDLADRDACMREAYDATRWYGRRGVVSHALSAINTALWDLAGRRAGRSCSDLAGRKRDRVLAYASVLFPETAEEAGQLAGELANRGFRAIKFGWGDFGRSHELDRARLAAIRAAVGDEILLMVDGGRCWTVAEALARGPELYDEFRLTWLEEPLHEDDLAGYTALAGAMGGRRRLAAGETEEAERFFVDLLDAGVGLIQPDVGRAGGLTGCLALSETAALRGAWCIPHSFGTGVNLAASAQWMAAAADARMTEFPVTPSPLRNELVVGMPEFRDGWVEIPDRPGLGIELDPVVLDRYRVA